MANAQGSSFQFCYVEETIWGTTPATPSMIKLPVTKVTGGLSKSTLEDNTLSGSRIRDLPRHGMNKVDLSVEGNLRYEDFDTFIAAACRSEWVTNVVSVGQTDVAFTGEKGFTDIVQYLPYTGLMVSKMTISIKPDAVIPVTFDFIAKNAGAATATPLDAAPTDYSTNKPFDSFTGSLTEGGTTTSIITGIDFTVDNQSQGSQVIFSDTIEDVVDGKAKVSGTVNCFFANATMLNKFVNETSSAIVVTLTDPDGNDLEIAFSSVKYMGGDPDVSGDGPIELAMPFEATDIQFTRTPHA